MQAFCKICKRVHHDSGLEECKDNLISKLKKKVRYKDNQIKDLKLKMEREIEDGKSFYSYIKAFEDYIAEKGLKQDCIESLERYGFEVFTNR